MTSALPSPAFVFTDVVPRVWSPLVFPHEVCVCVCVCLFLFLWFSLCVCVSVLLLLLHPHLLWPAYLVCRQNFNQPWLTVQLAVLVQLLVGKLNACV